MMRTILPFLLSIPMLSFAQDTTKVLGKDLFVRLESVEDNEWGTQDTLIVLLADFSENVEPLLEFYSYKDQGGDCNNLFWMKETLTIEEDQFLLLSHRFQKTGIDPIPEWRKRIYVMNVSGRLELIYDRYKYYGASEWVHE